MNKARLNLYLESQELHRRIKAAAAEAGLTLSEYCVQAIEARLSAGRIIVPDRTAHGDGDLAPGGLALEDLAGASLGKEELGGEESGHERIANGGLADEDLADEDLADEDLADEDLGNEDLGNEDLGNEDLGNEDLGSAGFIAEPAAIYGSASSLSTPLLREIRRRAFRHGQSPDAYLEALMRDDIEGQWPPEFFLDVIGGWRGEALERSPQGEPESRDGF